MTVVGRVNSRGAKEYPMVIDAVISGVFLDTNDVKQHSQEKVRDYYDVAKHLSERYGHLNEKNEYLENNWGWIADQFEGFIAYFDKQYCGFRSSKLANCMIEYISAYKSFANSADDNTALISEKSSGVINAFLNIQIFLEKLEKQYPELQECVFNN